MDIAGQERFWSKDADGILLMYDISNYKSFKDIKVWMSSIQESVNISKIALIIIGNKYDLSAEKREVDENLKVILENNFKLKIIEAFVKDNINVYD